MDESILKCLLSDWSQVLVTGVKANPEESLQRMALR